MDDNKDLPAKTTPPKAQPAERKRPRLRDPRRNPISVLESVEDVKEMLVLAEKASVDQDRTVRDRPRFMRIRAWIAAEEAIANARIEKEQA